LARFLIIEADVPHGRGTRGANLARFLRTYFGPQSVELIASADLRAGPPRSADFLFVGVPSDLRAADLERARFGRAALFDYGDLAGAQWGKSDIGLLSSVSRLYLKPWIEPGWDQGLSWGVLPIRRRPRLAWHVKAFRALFGSRYPEVVRRDHDVSFVGHATKYYGVGLPAPYDQRVAWLSEVVRDPLRAARFWGGLQASPTVRERLKASSPSPPDVIFERGRVPYPLYFYHLLRSRVALTPSGNARWTYRHYEAIYAGAIPVTTDFRQIRTLIPLPVEGMVHVPDHASVLPAIDRALALRADHPETARQNLAFLEGYLSDGNYDRAKPALAEAFLAQLGEVKDLQLGGSQGKTTGS
jgi:hypothetical protein